MRSHMFPKKKVLSWLTIYYQHFLVIVRDCYHHFLVIVFSVFQNNQFSWRKEKPTAKKFAKNVEFFAKNGDMLTSAIEAVKDEGWLMRGKRGVMVSQPQAPSDSSFGMHNRTATSTTSDSVS